MFENIIYVAQFIAKTIVEWLNLNDAKVLFLQYLTVVILSAEIVLDVLASKKLISAPSWIKIIQKMLRNGTKLFINLLTIVLCDVVIRQYLPSGLRETLNANGKNMADICISILIYAFLIILLGSLTGFLKTINGSIALLTKGETKTLTINDEYDTGDYPKLVVSVIVECLRGLVVVTVFLLNAIVTYYNYCM